MGLLIILFVLTILIVLSTISTSCTKTETYIDQIPIYIISLKRSPERKKNMENMFKNTGLSFTYFDAVDGKNMSIEEKQLADKYISPTAHLPDFSGEVGCYLSHVLLLKHIKKSEHPNTLILEDDAVINDFNLIKNIKNMLIQDYDVMFLGHCGETKGKVVKIVKDPYTLRESIRPRCLHGYVISQKGVDNMLKIFENQKGEQAVDHIFANSKLQNYSMHPQLIKQSGIQSTIRNLKN